MSARRTGIDHLPTHVGKVTQGKKKTSSGDTSRMHPYIARAIAAGVSREDWTTSVIERHKDGSITITIKKKNV